MPIVNGHQAECGCYVEGSWGQYGPDHLADQAEGFGWDPLEHQDPRVIRAEIELAEQQALKLVEEGWTPPPFHLADQWERHSDAAEEIEVWLNDHTLAMRKSDGVNCFWHGQWYTDDGNGTPVPDEDVQQFTWHWHDGEFFLSPICDPDMREECTDDTCAHWD